MKYRLFTITALSLLAGTAFSQASTVLYDYASASTKSPANNGWTLSSDAQQSTTNYIGSYDASTTTFKDRHQRLAFLRRLEVELHRLYDLRHFVVCILVFYERVLRDHDYAV